MNSKFKDWNNQLLLEMESLPHCVGYSGGALIDSKIPYDLGWSPKRTARAFLNYDNKDYHKLLEVMREKGLLKERVKKT